MKKALIIVGISLLTLIVAIGGYGFYMYKSVQGTVDNQMHMPLEREKSEKRFEPVDIEEQEPLSFLLLGIDAQDSDRGRTDTIIVLTVNPNDNSMKMVSIPRDTRTEMVGRGFDDKINHAFAFGGAEMSVNTVENFLDIPIDYYATVNMSGFKDIVDAVGGVTVDNDFAFNQSGHHFEEGEIFLDGDQALAFARMRKQDTRGDFGRNDRQRQIVMGIIEEGAQFSSLTRAGSILDALGNNVNTDVSFDEMVKIQENYRSARHNMDTLEITGSGTRIDNIYYLVVPEEERLRVSGELRAHLGLDDSNEAVASVEEGEDTDEES